MAGKPQRRRVLVRSLAVWAFMDRRNLTQNQLAGLLGLTSGYLSQVINGVKSPSAALRQRMQDVLGVEFDDLFETVEARDV